MTRPDTIDPAEAARITRDIAETASFLEQVFDDPSLIDGIPSGSTLAFRSIPIHGEELRLIAFRPSRSNAAWTSRLLPRQSGGDLERTKMSRRLPRDAGSARPDHKWDDELHHIVISGQTAEDALDALEAVLQERASADHAVLAP